MQKHNLDIQNYTFDEILGLFDLSTYQLSTEDMKRAKKKVLMLHPDKSRLQPEYFLFYKKAYEVIFQFYQNQERQNQIVDEKSTKYQPEMESHHNKQVQRQVAATIEKMNPSDFQSKFNHLFEKNEMVARPDPRKNDWFVQEGASITVSTPVSANNLGQTFQTIKQQQQNAGLVQYSGVQDLYSSISTGSSQLYEDMEDNLGQGQYINSDPFSRLKFDDLRKVHKDQTVFAVNETDFQNMPKYNSVEQLNRERGKYSYDPLDKVKAQQMLDQRDKLHTEQMMRKEYQAKLQSEQMAKKNQSVMASFLQLR